MLLTKKMEDALNKQINEELFSSYLYLSMAAYFDSLNFKGFANWMKVQSREENNHAMKLYGFVNEKGGRVQLAAIKEPQSDWKSPLDAFEAAYNHEIKITTLIYNLVNMAQTEKDHSTAAMLQWFVNEQVEEEASADEIVQMLKKIKDAPQALFMLDAKLSERK
jgi:ferritin